MVKNFENGRNKFSCLHIVPTNVVQTNILNIDFLYLQYVSEVWRSLFFYPLHENYW